MISFNNVSERLYIPEEQIKDIYNASKGKSKREQAAIVKNDIEKYRKNLDKRLRENTFSARQHNTIRIQENSCKKTRDIVKPRYMYEQMAHHSLMRVFAPIAMKGMYYHVYGSIPGRGVHKGKKTVEKWIREDPKNCKYIYKLDIRHFFESIPHRRLKKALKRKIRDRELLKRLFAVIDSHKPGLPLGYYPSQWFGNFYLQPLDHFIKEKLHAIHCIRFADDMVIFGNNKKTLHKIRKAVEDFIKNKLGLEVKKNWQVFRFDYTDRNGKRHGRPLDFMGFKFYRDRTTIRKSILKGILAKVNKVKRKKKITWVDATSLLSRLGWIWHSNAYAKVEGIGIGWIWTAYLKKDGNTTTKENTIITNKQDKTQKLFDGVVKAQPTLNVRTWAGTEYPKIKKVPELLNGREVEVMNYTQKDTAGAKWYYVRITCGEKKYFGFCKAQYIVKK